MRKPTDNMAVARRIKLAFMAKGLSRTDFAALLTDCSLQRLNGWINEGKKPHWDHLAEIAEYTQVTTDWLIMGDMRFVPSLSKEAILAKYAELVVSEPEYAHTKIE